MAEKKYIDADSVIKDLRRIVAEPWNRQAAPASWADAYEDLIDILESEPAADVRPAKRGEWVSECGRCVDNTPVYDTWSYSFCGVWSCSVCGKRFDEWDERPSWNFCPNCGADMREES